MDDKLKSTHRVQVRRGASRKQLSAKQVAMIEEAIKVVGEFGEVRLIVDRGRLHYITAQKSFNAHNYRPGSITAEFDQNRK